MKIRLMKIEEITAKLASLSNPKSYVETAKNHEVKPGAQDNSAFAHALRAELKNRRFVGSPSK